MPEVFGTAWVEIAGDFLYDLMVALKDTMQTAGTYTPEINYVYRKHDEVMLMNAVSVDLVGVESEPISTGAVIGITYKPQYSIRIHTDYIGGVVDGHTISRLLNSVVNKLDTNISLSDDYKIDDVSGIVSDQRFEESYTVGGQVLVTVQITISQERE